MTTDATVAEPRRAPETWIPLLVAVCACGAVQLALYLLAPRFVLGLSFWGVGGIAGRFVTGMTLAAIIGILAWAVTWFGFVARTGADVMDRYFLIIMGSSMAVGALFAGLLVLPDVLAQSSMRDVERERLQVAAEATTFENALGRTMAGGVLKPGEQRGDLAADRAKVVAGLRLVDDYRQRQMARFAQAQGGGAAHSSLRLLVGDYWTDMGAQLQETDAELIDLGKARGAWRLSAATGVTFSNMADLQAYNAHQLRLQTIGRRLERERTQLLAPGSASGGD